MFELLQFIGYLLFIVAPIGTTIHEAGHAIGARIVRADHIQLSVGLGRKIKAISLKTLTINIHALFFVGGSVRSVRIPAYTSMEWAFISILGPLHNVFYALIFYYVSSYYAYEYMQLLFLFNLWLAMVNIIPFQIKERRSDGYTILKTLLGRHKTK